MVTFLSTLLLQRTCGILISISGEELGRYLPHDYPLNELVGLVETSIGKMVPIMSQKDLEEDPLQVFAEPYNTLIVSKKGFKNPIPHGKEYGS